MNSNSAKTAKLAAELADDPAVEKQVMDEIARHSMISSLITIRLDKGITQDQVAKYMGCDPSKISRLENSSDDQLKWNDVGSYADALGLDLYVSFEDREVPEAQRIKQCVFRIRDSLDQLTKLAEKVGSDDKIAKRIHEFSGEVLFNFLIQYTEHSDQLKSIYKVPTQSRIAKSKAVEKAEPQMC